MNPDTQYQLFFPAVKVGHYADLITVDAASYKQQDDRWCSLGRQASIHKNHLKPLLENSRVKEKPATRHLDIAIDFMDLNGKEVDGNSFDLAVLLADKIARLHPEPDKLPCIVATGKVTDDLRVVCVDSFGAKVERIQAALDANEISKNSLFCYPKANHAEAETALKQLGIRLYAVQTLQELQGLWTGEPDEPDSPQNKPNWLRNLFITTMLLLALVWVMAETCLLPVPHCQQVTGECKALNCASDFIDPKAFKLQYQYYSKAEGYHSTHALFDHQVLHTGDQFKLSFQAPVDAYVYVYYLSAENELQELFSLLNKPRLAPRQETIVLPNETQSFTLRGATGTESIYFVASKVPETQLFEQYQQLMQAGNTPQAAQLKNQLLQSLQNYRSLTIQHQP